MEFEKPLGAAEQPALTIAASRTNGSDGCEYSKGRGGRDDSEGHSWWIDKFS